MERMCLSIASGSSEYESVFKVDKPDYCEEYFRIGLSGLTWYAHNSKRKREELSDDTVGYDAYISGRNILLLLIYADDTSELLTSNGFCQYKWSVKPWASIHKCFDVHSYSEVTGYNNYKGVKTVMVAPDNNNGYRYLGITREEI